MKEQRKYDREFKLNTVKLYREGNKTLEELGKDLGIPKSTLCGWIKEFKEHGEDSYPGKGKLLPCNEEVYRLRKQLADVTMERDILKKAAAIFLKPKG